MRLRGDAVDFDAFYDLSASLPAFVSIRPPAAIVIGDLAGAVQFRLPAQSRGVRSAGVATPRTVGYLASDELEGRGIDTAGIQKAADFLATQFQAAGLSTTVFDGNAFQPFVVSTGAELGPRDENRLVLSGPAPPAGGSPSTIELKLGESFGPLAIGGTGQVQAPVAFLGYGISAPPHQYDDYAGLDVKGKVVVLLRKEPQQENPQSVFNGRQSSRYAHFAAKVSNAFQQGAAAVILVNDKLTVTQAAATAQRQWKEALDRLNSLREKFQALAEPSDGQFAEHRAEVLKVTKELESLDQRLRGDFDPILPLDGAGTETSHPQLPVFFAKRALIDEMLKPATGTSLDELESKIDEGPAPQSRAGRLDGRLPIPRDPQASRSAKRGGSPGGSGATRAGNGDRWR